MKASIKLEGVSFSRGAKAVLRNISAAFYTREFSCLIGPNGAGKTTLAQIITGELSPTKGQVLLRKDKAAEESPETGRYVAYLPQDLQDPPFVTVRELVTLGRFRPRYSLGWKVDKQDKEAVQRYINECLADSLAERPFAHLSGGEKQRVWLAFCLAQERDFLLLDESLHKLDFQKRNIFFRMLSDLAKHGKGIVLVTHDLQMALQHGNRILMLGGGELVYDGPPDTVIYSLMEQQN